MVISAGVPIPITSIQQPGGTLKNIPKKGLDPHGDWTGSRKNSFNGSMYYSIKKVRHVFRLRITAYSYSIVQIGEEGAGKTTRAYYPHAAADGQFSITVFLIGYSEKEALMRWIAWYGSQLFLKDDVEGGIAYPWMSVIILKENGKSFRRDGIPLTGMQFGDHVGAGWWTPTITFESAKDPSWNPSKAPKQGAHPDTTNIGYFYPNAKNIDDLHAPDIFDPIVPPDNLTPDPAPTPTPGPAPGDPGNSQVGGGGDFVGAAQAAAQAAADRQAGII